MKQSKYSLNPNILYKVRNYISKKLVVRVAIANIILFSVFFLVITQADLHISPDSTKYITAARNLSEGKGLTLPSYEQGQIILKPMKHWAPLLAILLSISIKLHIDPIVFATCINIFCLAGTSLLVFNMLMNDRVTNLFIPLAGMFLVLYSGTILRAHSWLLTEPSFIFLSQITIWCFLKHTQNGFRRWLIWSSCFAALALLNRFAGGALILTLIIALLFSNSQTIANKTISIFGTLVLSITPFVIWYMWVLSENTSGIRQFNFHMPDHTHIRNTFTAIANWVLPPRWITAASSVFFTCVIIILTISLYFKNHIDSNVNVYDNQHKVFSSNLAQVQMLFSVIYFTFLGLSVTFFDFAIPMDSRILAPLYVPILLVILSNIDKISFHRYPSLVTFSSFLLITVLFGLQVVGWARGYTRLEGYTSFESSETLKQLKKIPEDSIIFSNGYDIILWFTNRQSVSIPHKWSPTSLENVNYDINVRDMASTDESRYIVWFNNVTWRDYLVTQSELAEILSMNILVELSDGTIYEIPPS